MAQKKGQTGNPNGRPKGTPNKVTSDLRAWVDELLSTNLHQIEKDLKELEPKERLMILEKFLSYTLPKRQSIDATIDSDYIYQPIFSFNILNDDESDDGD
jgi:hypothetical protein